MIHSHYCFPDISKIVSLISKDIVNVHQPFILVRNDNMNEL